MSTEMTPTQQETIQFKILCDKKEQENKNTLMQIKTQILLLERQRAEFKEEQKEQAVYYQECNKQLLIRAEAIENAVRDCSDDELVCVNVGSTIFQTLKSTICMSPYFQNIFSDKWRDLERKTIRDKDGNIFIDRNPEHFAILLNWSRDGQEPQEMSEIIDEMDDSRSFIKTLDYFGIDHESYLPTELTVGCKIQTYWRGDKSHFNGTVKRIITTKKTTFVVIHYEDSSIWKYDIKKLSKQTGHYKDKRGNTDCMWWHYDEYKGSIKLASKTMCSNRKPDGAII